MQNLLLAGMISLLSISSAFAQSDGECLLFEHDGFRGRIMSMYAGEAVNLRSSQFWNDRVSSVDIARGCTLTMYEDTEMSGDVSDFEGRVPALKEYGWNDRMSSATCSCGR